VNIKRITYEDFTVNYKDRYGIVKLGCGGDLQEWVRGMEEVLRENSVINGMVVEGELWDEVLLITTPEGRQDMVFLTDDAKMPAIKVWMWKAPNHIDDVLFVREYKENVDTKCPYCDDVICKPDLPSLKNVGDSTDYTCDNCGETFRITLTKHGLLINEV
jgi:DNA-directed RNA polymerase subunit RPC12/RpoP